MKPTRLALAQTYWPGSREQAIDVYSLLVADAARAGVQPSQPAGVYAFALLSRHA